MFGKRWKLGLNLLLLLLVVIGAVGFAGYNKAVVPTGAVIVNIDNSGNKFVNEGQINELIFKLASATIDSAKGQSIDLALLEKELLTSFSFVKEAQAAWDLKGNLVINVRQDEPIARLMAASGKGAYLTRERQLLPLSDKFTARVMMITGSGADSLLSETFLRSGKGLRVCDLVDHISDSDFLSRQITQLDINRWMNITMYPQIGNQRFEFGRANNFDEKFKKMDIFYKEIIPKRGWNAYDVVKLQYKDQIVCK